MFFDIPNLQKLSFGEVFRAVFGEFWGVLGSLGASWARLGRALGASWSARGRLGGVLGQFWGVLGPFWDALGDFWIGLEESWKLSGSIFGAFLEDFRLS